MGKRFFVDSLLGMLNSDGATGSSDDDSVIEDACQVGMVPPNCVRIAYHRTTFRGSTPHTK